MKARNVRLFSESGRRLIAVPLARDGKYEAIINQADYLELLDLGVFPNWRARGGSVVAHSRGGSVPVARVLMSAKEGERVRYRDGDRLNLRRENLEVVTGWSSKNDRQIVLEARVASVT